MANSDLVCNCKCHDPKRIDNLLLKDVRHITSCCSVCPICNLRIKSYYFSSHIKLCHLGLEDFRVEKFKVGHSRKSNEEENKSVKRYYFH